MIEAWLAGGIWFGIWCTVAAIRWVDHVRDLVITKVDG